MREVVGGGGDSQNYFPIPANHHPRAGWEVAFAEMAKHQDDLLLDEASTTEWGLTEWEWLL